MPPIIIINILYIHENVTIAQTLVEEFKALILWGVHHHVQQGRFKVVVGHTQPASVPHKAHVHLQYADSVSKVVSRS